MHEQVATPLELSAASDEHASIRAQLRERVTDDVSLLVTASQFRMTPATIRKVLAGEPMSHYVEKKLRAVFEGRSERGPRQPDFTKYYRVYGAYRAHGTLEGAAAALGVRTQRVHQVLLNGSRLGLFDYRPRRRRVRANPAARLLRIYESV
jgi:hypothetical protein